MKEKKIQLVTMFFMVLIMTFVVVFASTAINFGFQDNFLQRWLKGWGISFALAYPTVLIIMPPIRKIVGRFMS